MPRTSSGGFREKSLALFDAQKANAERLRALLDGSRPPIRLLWETRQAETEFVTPRRARTHLPWMHPVA